MISRDVRQQVAGAELLARSCRIERSALPPSDHWEPEPVLDAYDAPVRVSSAFTADERLLDVARENGAIRRRDLFGLAAQLPAEPSDDEVRCLVLNVNAWGYGTIGFGHNRTLKVEAAPTMTSRAVLALRAVQSEGPTNGYLALQKTGTTGSAQHVERWGPVLFTKFLYVVDPGNRPGASPDRPTALPLDRHLATAMNALVPSKPVGTFAVGGWTAQQYAFYTAMVQRLAGQLSRADLTLTPGMVEAVLGDHYRGRA